MRNLVSPLLSITALLIAIAVGVLHFTSDSGPNSASNSSTSQTAELYQPALEHDPPTPQPPESAIRDFDTFLDRLREASQNSVTSLVLHKDALVRAEQVFRESAGVPDNVPIEMHSPFFTVDPEAIFALYFDLPTLERGLGLFQQHCSQCHGPYGRGNGSATQRWYTGNFPRNFWYGKFKNRSTEYGTVPTDGDLYRTLTRGLYGSTMPPFRHLSAEDRWSLVEFIKSLAGFYDDYDETVVNRFDSDIGNWSAAPLEIGEEPTVTLESVTRGRILFIEQGCVKCHQSNKSKPVGLARWEGGFDSWLDEMNRPIEHSRDLTNQVFRSGAASSDLFRIISGGPTIGPMPSYLNIAEEKRWDLVHYVQSVFKPDYPQAPATADAQANPPKTGDDNGTGAPGGVGSAEK
ncbi:MAG: c-type cytochrome [Pirellulaceae bacterium]|nr:c-type cytochrome [Planctomycetaceae bacterium]HIM29571.1 c-type cytochrome [Planctomycetota bacterium]